MYLRLNVTTREENAFAGVTLVWPPPYGLPELSRAANDGASDIADRCCI